MAELAAATRVIAPSPATTYRIASARPSGRSCATIPTIGAFMSRVASSVCPACTGSAVTATIPMPV